MILTPEELNKRTQAVNTIIEQWFTEVDASGAGAVFPQEWIRIISKNPRLIQILQDIYQTKTLTGPQKLSRVMGLGIEVGAALDNQLQILDGMVKGRFYSAEDGDLKPGVIDIELSPAGVVTSVWFRCHLLPFTSHSVDDARASLTLKAYAEMPFYPIHGIIFKDDPIVFDKPGESSGGENGKGGVQ